MTDTSTEQIQKTARALVDLGFDYASDIIHALAAERGALKAELHEVRMQAIVDFGKLQKACEERDALKAEVERLRGENELMRAQLDSLPPPEPGLLKRRLREIADKKTRAALQESTDD
jgi:hypothetical protein